MTGYTVHTGSTKKFSTNWDQIFRGKQAAPSQTKEPATPRKKKTPKKK